MATKERYQNPVIDDDVNLRFFTYNSNNRSDVFSISTVDIYYLDPTLISSTNTDGRRLVLTVDGDDVTSVETGHYMVNVTLESEVYVIGNYIDVWTVVVRENETENKIEQQWQVYPDLWYTTPMPIVYDFSFDVRPNRIRQKSIKYLIIGIHPNVPRASDLERYYTNLAIVSNVKIYIEQACGDCMPAEKDLRLVVDGDDVELREKCQAFYLLDTTDMDCGIYNVYFRMEMGENVYISDNQQIEIY
jgi:hypothetical protein